MICWLLVIVYFTRSTRYQALPGNAGLEALPPICPSSKRGRASRNRFPGSALEPVKCALVLSQKLLVYSLPGSAWERRFGGSASNLSKKQPRQILAYISSQAEPWNQLNVHWYYPKNL
jgi:hypothetical protein